MRNKKEVELLFINELENAIDSFKDSVTNNYDF